MFTQGKMLVFLVAICYHKFIPQIFQTEIYLTALKFNQVFNVLLREILLTRA